MLKVAQNENGDVVMAEPDGALQESDFATLDSVVDSIIEKKGELQGLLIHARSFPGWDSFGAFLSHSRFIKEHHDKIAKVAVVTDSPLGDFAELVGKLIKTDVRHFDYDDLDEAQAWLGVG